MLGNAEMQDRTLKLPSASSAAVHGWFDVLAEFLTQKSHECRLISQARCSIAAFILRSSSALLLQ
jgi:hypothetical protein